jgi:uracil-DNA glycosylase
MSAARVAPTRRLPRLLEEIRACQECRAHLPLGPRPILRAGPTARLLIIGQAPGARVHASGVAWDDPSGDRLRDWLGIDRPTFYDEGQVAIVPMGFCYPGRGESGDQPPRPECAPLWHPRLLPLLPAVGLTLLIGAYAQAHYLPRRPGSSLTETVRGYRGSLPRFFPLPHPSPRNALWRKKNPWFEREVLPALRRRVKKALAAP